MNAPPLPRQQDCLRAIKRSLDAKGVAPSYDELMDELGLASKSGVHRLIIGLEDRGAIKRLPGRPRAIQIVDADASGRLSFLDPSTRLKIISAAEKRGCEPESVVAEICLHWRQRQ